MTSPDILEIGKWIGGLLASGGGAALGVKRYLNGQARGIHRIESKLDGHVSQTAENFTKIQDSVSDVRERVSGVEGYLGMGRPQERRLH